MVQKRKMRRKASTEGFTIIETIIVLAIAGLILLVVLMAIPALTRNSRNNQRKQDVQTILEAVSRWELNNSGGLPSTAELDNFLTLYGKLSAYEPANVSIITPAATDTVSPTTNATDIDHVVVYNHLKCDTADPGSGTNAGAGFNDIAALYSIEGGSGVSRQCQQL